jgi:hypothetical protein
MRPRNLLSCDPAKTAVARRVRSAAAAPEKGAQRIQTQPLLQLLQSERIDRLDAIKIDVEGSEDRILVLFFRSAPRLLWPRLREDAGDAWSMDLFSFLVTTGYTIAARSEQNVMLHLESAHP